MRTVENYDRNMKTTKRITAFSVCRILFFGCFFCAIFIANTIWKNEASWIAYMHQSMFHDNKLIFDGGVDCLIKVLGARLPVWGCLIIFGRTWWGIISAQVWAGWQGFLYGIIFSSFLIRYGVYGIFVFACMSLPQLPVYVVAYILLYRKNMSERSGDFRARIYTSIYGREQLHTKKEIGFYFLLSTLFMTGVWLESYVNVIVLTKMVDLIGKI